MTFLPIFAIWVPSVSWARVYLGVHYPSDTLVGGLVGLVCCVIGEAIGGAIRDTCLPCSTLECYAYNASSDCIIGSDGRGGGNFSLVGFFDGTTGGDDSTCYKFDVALVATAIVVAIFLLAVSPCVAFFTKSANVLGMIFPAIVFHITMLCKPASLLTTRTRPAALHVPNVTGAEHEEGTIHIAIASVFGLLLASVYVANKFCGPTVHCDDIAVNGVPVRVL